MQKTLLYSSMLVLASMAIMTGAEAQKNIRVTHSSSTHSTYLYVDEDTTISPSLTYITYKDDRLYNFALEQDKIVELFVDKRKVPADSFYVYQPLVNKLWEQIKKDKAQAEEDEKQALQDKEQAEADAVQARADKVQAEKDAIEAEQDKVQAEEDAVEAKEDKVQAEEDRKQAMEDKVQAEKEAQEERVQVEEDRKQAKLDAVQAQRDREQAQKDRVQAQLDAKQAAEDRAVMKSLLVELVKEGLVPDEKSVRSLHLNEDEFIINGKLQSEELHKKYMTKFLVRPGRSISYSREE